MHWMLLQIEWQQLHLWIEDLHSHSKFSCFIFLLRSLTWREGQEASFWGKQERWGAARMVNAAGCLLSPGWLHSAGTLRRRPENREWKGGSFSSLFRIFLQWGTWKERNGPVVILWWLLLPPALSGILESCHFPVWCRWTPLGITPGILL